jgi:hypothetical protein
MTNPITPPPELIEKWWDLIPGRSTDWKRQLCTQAAQWGADQELEACVEWLQDPDLNVDTYKLRAARRSSLKEQALEVLKSRDLMQPLLDDGSRILQPDELDTILRAVEALP